MGEKVMSRYDIAPAPHEAETFAFWEGGFSESQCFQIKEIGEKLIPQVAIVGEGRVDKEIRRSKTSWLACNDETMWVYDKLAWIVRQLNGQFFQFDIQGFKEDLQYTVYSSEDKGHYDYHMDNGFWADRAPRKLSLVLQLSSPDEYEGGDLELLTGSEPFKARRDLGILYAFPSYILHRVTPVTKGTRRSLVAWLTGPRFR